MTVQRYDASHKAAWDALVSAGKNSTFLFHRDYMDYHSDRFKDFSLMIYRAGKLAGLLPANLKTDNTLVSHQGLTYGGLVVPRDATVCDVLECFHAALRFLKEQGIENLLYKRVPGFYNTLPDDEVAYALFLLEAQWVRCDTALVVVQSERLPFQERRRRSIKKAQKANLRVMQETTFQPFWEGVLVPRLEGRYGVKPVHSLAEISLLASRFPENIKQFSVYSGETILAGCTIYETATVAHAQYIAVTDDGQALGALDFLFGWLIDEGCKMKRYFDFGICNEQEGRAVNLGLLDWKEGFGGRTFAHTFHQIPTAAYAKLESVLAHRLLGKEKSVAVPSGVPQKV
ncbi:MAG: GNAT family N-acetyltransferase [Verrucomicrobiales bacterium]|nr:MAG: GNAT family N-acetyltransferase [Verrucomicrobiales bacterium]